MDLLYGCKRTYFFKQKVIQLLAISKDSAVLLGDIDLTDLTKATVDLLRFELDHEHRRLRLLQKLVLSYANFSDPKVTNNGRYLWLPGQHAYIDLWKQEENAITYLNLPENLKSISPIMERIDGDWVYYVHRRKSDTAEFLWKVERYNMKTLVNEDLWAFTSAMWTAEQSQRKESDPNFPSISSLEVQYPSFSWLGSLVFVVVPTDVLSSSTTRYIMVVDAVKKQHKICSFECPKSLTVQLQPANDSSMVVLLRNNLQLWKNWFPILHSHIRKPESLFNLAMRTVTTNRECGSVPAERRAELPKAFCGDAECDHFAKNQNRHYNSEVAKERRRMGPHYTLCHSPAGLSGSPQYFYEEKFKEIMAAAEATTAET